MGNKKLNSEPDLKVLPPTTEVFETHIYRAHLQAAVLMSYKSLDPPDLIQIHYGWKFDPDEASLMPETLPVDVSPVPVEVLQMIKCGCSTCSTSRCSCSAAKLSCSVFCNCHNNQECRNEHTVINVTSDDDNDNDSY